MNEQIARDSEVGGADYGSHGFSFRVEMLPSQVYDTPWKSIPNMKKYPGRQIRQSAAGSKILRHPIVIRERSVTGSHISCTLIKVTYILKRPTGRSGFHVFQIISY